jgi:hypothetical protein
VTRGVDDSRTNRSSIVQGTRTIPPFARGDAAFNALVACMRAQFQRYNVDITTVDPGTATHFEMMVGGLPSDIGMSSGVLGVAPWAGGPLIPNAIAFTFAAQGIHGDPFELCVTTAHEAGHLMGLDHHLIAADHMSYLDAPEKSFVDATASCGEFAPRACAFGPTQNTDQRLRFTVGPRPLVFGDGFENLPPFTDRPQQRSGAPVAPFACGLDPRAPTLPAAIYRRPSGPVVDASEARRRP